MRMGGGFCRYARIPGMPASLGRSDSISSSAESLRSLRGFRCMKTMPWFEPVAPREPALEKNSFTLGSCLMISATWRWFLTSASKEMPSCDSVKAMAMPTSSLGRKPLGTATKSGTIATSTNSENTITVRRCESDHFRPRS